MAMPSGPDRADAILKISGASTIEELDESEYERYEDLLERPVYINTASESKLLSCGLFSRYQVASITDYRRRSGDIRSMTELAAMDGFNETSADILRPFISLDSAAPPGSSSQMRRAQGEADVRASARMDGSLAYTAKLRLVSENRWSVAATARNSYADIGRAPGTWSFCAVRYGRRIPSKLVIGDFNARFGQGLALWSGFSMSGVTATGAFSKRPGGISPSWSASPDGPVRGIAGDIRTERITISAAAMFPGLRQRMDGSGKAATGLVGAVNVARTGRRSEASLTATAGSAGDRNSPGTAKVSADLRWAPGTVTLFGETAADIVQKDFAATVGGIWSIAYQKEAALMLRHFGSSFGSDLCGAARSSSKCCDESAISAGVSLPHFKSTLDAARFPNRGSNQMRLVCSTPLVFGSHLTVTPRGSFKWKDGDKRMEMRMDAEAVHGISRFHVRADVVHAAGTAWQCYAEYGLKNEKCSFFARAGMFRVENWDDRIYVYERDAQGSFNVPALYGSGYNSSLTASLKKGRNKFFLRISRIRYVTDKPGRTEFKLQYLRKF